MSNEKEKIQAGLAAVSYTHLDVYKRQGIDPVEVIEKYGADTLRFMLITGNTPGNDMRFIGNV